MIAPTDDELLAAIPLTGRIGLRDLAAALGATNHRETRRIGDQGERLAREGRLHIHRTTGGARDGDREFSRDGDSVETLRAQLAASQARAARIQAAAFAAHQTLTAALFPPEVP